MSDTTKKIDNDEEEGIRCRYESDLVWYVWRCNPETYRIEPYNIFEHEQFRTIIANRTIRFLKNKPCKYVSILGYITVRKAEGFRHEIKTYLRSYFDDNYNYEFFIGSHHNLSIDNLQKFNAYNQVMLNFDCFMIYLLKAGRQMAEYRKKHKEEFAKPEQTPEEILAEVSLMKDDRSDEEKEVEAKIAEAKMQIALKQKANQEAAERIKAEQGREMAIQAAEKKKEDIRKRKELAKEKERMLEEARVREEEAMIAAATTPAEKKKAKQIVDRRRRQRRYRQRESEKRLAPATPTPKTEDVKKYHGFTLEELKKLEDIYEE